MMSIQVHYILEGIWHMFSMIYIRDINVFFKTVYTYSMYVFIAIETDDHIHFCRVMSDVFYTYNVTSVVPPTCPVSKLAV